MIRGQYIAATGMMLQRRRMENITNNITNAETVGYRKETLVSHSFDDVLLRRINDTNARGYGVNPGPFHFGAQVDELFTSFDMGILEETGRDSDMALIGDAFFVFDTQEGDRYTKAGAFIVNPEGYLVDGEGHYLRGTGGNILVGHGKFTVDERGNVMVNGENRGTLMIVRFEDNAQLRKEGSNLFSAGGAAPTAANNFIIRQGFVENANVDIGREMVDMLTTYRAYETNQRILTMIDESLGRGVNDIGRLR